MLSEGNAREWWKTTIGPISKKSNLICTCSILFCTFLCRCFARLQHETSRNFLVTLFKQEMSYVFSFTFFSLPLIFTLHWWPLAFPILSPLLQNFHVVLVNFSKTTKCTRPMGSCAFVGLWKVYLQVLNIPNCSRNHLITYT